MQILKFVSIDIILYVILEVSYSSSKKTTETEENVEKFRPVITLWFFKKNIEIIWLFFHDSEAFRNLKSLITL